MRKAQRIYPLRLSRYPDGSRTARPKGEALRGRAGGTSGPKPGLKGGCAAGGTPVWSDSFSKEEGNNERL